MIVDGDQRFLFYLLPQYCSNKSSYLVSSGGTPQHYLDQAIHGKGLLLYHVDDMLRLCPKFLLIKHSNKVYQVSLFHPPLL